MRKVPAEKRADFLDRGDLLSVLGETRRFGT